MHQTRIDFARGQQLAALRALDLPAFVACRDGTNVSAAAILAVLRVVDDHAGKSGQCWAKARTIAAEAKIGLRTVRRALEAASQIGLLIRAPARTSHGHPLVAYRICWPNVMSEDAPAPHEPSAMVAEPSAMVAEPSAMVALPSEAPQETTKETPPPPSPDAGDEANVEEEELLRLGINHPEGALRAARRHHSEGTIRALIEHYLAHRDACGWRPGALFARLRSPQPAIVEAWPAADPVAAAKHRIAKPIIETPATAAFRQQQLEEMQAKIARAKAEGRLSTFHARPR